MADHHFQNQNWNERDEYYTPPILVNALVEEYVDSDLTVWCPFDTKNSEFVLQLQDNGNDVIYSHLIHGKDFFEYEPEEEYDAIISNPPFTKKMDVLERLFDIDKPFAMALGMPILNYQSIGKFFYDQQEKGNDLELLIVDKKVSFDGNTSMFNTSFFCYNFLPKQLIFKHLPHNNRTTNFEGSNMAGDLPINFE